MNITFDNILERDMDMLLMRQFTQNNKAYIKLFLGKIGLNSDYSILSVSHSVMTSDGESDIEVILEIGGEKIAILIEDKINAIAQPDQAKRYEIRGRNGIEAGKYNSFYTFIVAPAKYLDGNEEAAKYPYKVSYEEVREVLSDEFEKAVLDCALDESKKGYVPIEDEAVTRFWDKMYDFVEERFPGEFVINGKKGDKRGSGAWWPTIRSGKGTRITIKADRGHVDLEIAGYADKFQEFSKANQDLLDSKKLYLRMATKSLAIRKYIDIIDFTKDFDEQVDLVEDAFLKVRELQDLVKLLRF